MTAPRRYQKLAKLPTNAGRGRHRDGAACRQKGVRQVRTAREGNGAGVSGALPRRFGQLLAELDANGMQPALRPAVDGIVACGTGLRFDVRTLLADPAGMRREFARVRALLLGRVPVTLTLADGGLQAARRIEQLLSRLRRAIRPACLPVSLLGLAVPASDLPLPAFMLMSKVLFGDGPRYALLDARHLERGHGQDDPDAAWTTLYQERGRRWRLQPVYATETRTRCSLLSDESAVTVLEPGGLLAPAATAWLPLVFNVCRFADRAGRIDETALLARLRRGVSLADQLFDRLLWIDAEQRRDAAANRRLAIRVDGLAEVLYLRGKRHGDFGGLRFLDRLLGRIHDCAWRESHRLAGVRGLLPALAARDPSLAVTDPSHRRHWRERWHEALQTAAVRHRNLLVLSPYALLPRGSHGADASLDLLPLLAHADVCGFSGATGFAGWSIGDFRQFHRRAWAVLARRSAAACVAAGV